MEPAKSNRRDEERLDKICGRLRFGGGELLGGDEPGSQHGSSRGPVLLECGNYRKSRLPRGSEADFRRNNRQPPSDRRKLSDRMSRECRRGLREKLEGEFPYYHEQSVPYK